MMFEHIYLHAACVSIGGKGVLLFGPSGSGKSDLALRLIDGGATLVSDDQVLLKKIDNSVYAFPPERIHGMLEARGIGIIRLPCVQDVTVNLAVKLVARAAVERMPPPQFFDCLGLQVPVLSLHAFDGSTPAKIRLQLT
jgi:serine kinase of HPr protein (carbohydrate metabolism regulator)